MPTDVGDAGTSAGIGGTRDELRMLVTATPVRGAAGPVGAGRAAAGGMQPSAKKAIESANAPRRRVVSMLTESYPITGRAFDTRPLTS